MTLEIGFEIASLFLVVEGNGGLDAPGAKWGCVRDRASVVTFKTLMQISGISYVVVGACGDICEYIDVIEGHILVYELD